MSPRSYPLWLAAAVLALVALFAFTTPAFAEGEPPPEAPAAPLAAPASGGADPMGPSYDGDPQGDTPAPLALKDLPIYTGGDPWWKIGSQLYATVFTGDPCPAGTTLGVSCWKSSTPIKTALDIINANGLIPSNRYIYVDSGIYNNTDNILINGATQPNLGQLRGIIGVTDQNNTPTPSLSGRIKIENMNAGFFLSGLKILADVSTFAAVEFSNNSGTLKLEDIWVRNTFITNNYGLYIDVHKGSVVLNRVRVYDNLMNGARIKTTATSGNIKITNSSFDDNGSASNRIGLDIDTDMNLLLDGVTASQNYGIGLRVERGDLTINRLVKISNSTFFKNDNNTIDALGHGILLNTAGTVILTNVHLDGNEEVGLGMKHRGNVTLTAVTFIDNQRQAFDIETCLSVAGVCTYGGAGKITLTDLIVRNNPSGLRVSAKGAITAKSLDVYQSRAYIENNFGSGNVSIQYASFDEALSGIGLEIHSAGAVYLRGIDVTNAEGQGLYVDTTYGHGVVQIMGGANITNNFSGNRFDGIKIDAHAAISLANVRSYNNGDSLAPFRASGARLDNDLDGRPYKVQVINSTFNNNFGSGLYINTIGAVTIEGVTASQNKNNAGVNPWDVGDGVRLDNPMNKYAVSVLKDGATNNSFTGNQGNGIYLVNDGAITINQTTAAVNQMAGINVTRNSVVVRPVSLKDVVAGNNSSTGIVVYNNGPITLTKVESNGNGFGGFNANGADLYISSATASSVIVTGGAFHDNHGNGLHIVTGGAISISNVAASGNIQRVIDLNSRYAGHGINVENHQGSKGVTITASSQQTQEVGNSISNNQGVGIRVQTKGAILVKNMTVINSGKPGNWAEHGVYLRNQYPDTTAPVAVFGLIVNTSEFDNLSVLSNGIVTLTRVTVGNAIGWGIAVDNSDATAAKAVNLTDCWAIGAAGHGIDVRSKGAITVTNVVAISNGGNGLYLSNNHIGISSPVTIKTSGSFQSQVFNNDRAIVITSRGAISVSGLLVKYSNNTTQAALYVRNDFAGTDQKVTVTNTEITDNQHTGLQIESLGVITLTSVNASGSSNIGAHIVNDDILATSEVKITKSTFSNNLGLGLWVTTLGKITLDTIDAEGNGDDGIYVRNNFGTSTAPVNAKNIAVNGNGSQGLSLQTAGSVTIAGLNANHNINGAIINSADGIGLIKMSKIEANFNTRTGMIVNAANSVNITKINASMNAISAPLGETRNGLTLTALGQAVTIKDGVFQGNHSYGIHVTTGYPAGSLTLINTNYFGNYHNNVFDLDLYWE